MSNVPEFSRKESKLKAEVQARNLATYTLQICSNKEHFPEKYHEALTSDLMETAKNIFVDCHVANKIRVSGADSQYKLKERLKLQQSAIWNCNRLLALIDLAEKVYKLRINRVEYWAKITLECRELIQKWHGHDRAKLVIK